MNQTLEQIKNFHGHLGPYVVIGYRMGKIANQKLGNNPFGKKATVYTGTTPPISCIIDGIQISSGCTMGKGNIRVENQKKPTADFLDKNGKKINITLKNNIQNKIDTEINDDNIENFSIKVYEMSDEELFQIRE